MSNRPSQPDIVLCDPDGSAKSWVSASRDGVEIATPSQKWLLSESAGVSMNSGVAVTDQQTGTRTIPAGAAVWKFTTSGDVMFGQNVLYNPTGSPSAWIPDFLYRADEARIMTRSLILSELGDPVDLAIQRADGTYPDGTPGQIKQGVSLGVMYWRGWTAEGGFNGRAAQIYAKSEEDQTNSASGGKLVLATTPNTTTNPLDRVIVYNTGEVEITGTPLTLSNSAANIGIKNLSSTSTSVLSVRLSTDTQSRYRLLGDGQIQWGDGTNGQDTILYRSAANVLKTDDSFHVALDLRHLGSNLGFYNHATATQQTVSGSRGSNAALASLLTALAATGLIVDGSSA